MASFRRSTSDKEPIRYSKNWVVGTVTRKLHGCLIVNHDVFIHKSAYVGAYETKDWFACLQEGDAVEFIAEEHIESKNRWRALSVRDPPSGYRRSEPEMYRNAMFMGHPHARGMPNMHPQMMPHPAMAFTDNPNAGMMMMMPAPPSAHMPDAYMMDGGCCYPAAAMSHYYPQAATGPPQQQQPSAMMYPPHSAPMYMPNPQAMYMAPAPQPHPPLPPMAQLPQQAMYPQMQQQHHQVGAASPPPYPPPGSCPQQPSSYLSCPPSPSHLSVPDPSRSSSPPSPYLRPLPATASPVQSPKHGPAKKPCPSPKPVLRGIDGKNTPHDASRTTNSPIDLYDDEECRSEASLSSHNTTERFDTLSTRDHSSSEQDIVCDAAHCEAAKAADVALYHRFFAQQATIEQVEHLLKSDSQSKGNNDSSSFLTTALGLVLDQPDASPQDVARVQELFLYLCTQQVFSQMHYRVAWVVASYKLAESDKSHQLAHAMLAHALAHRYLQMDALKLIIAPLKASGIALPFVIATLVQVLSIVGLDQLVHLHGTSSFKIQDADDSVTPEEITQRLLHSNLALLISNNPSQNNTPACSQVDALADATARTTISA